MPLTRGFQGTGPLSNATWTSPCGTGPSSVDATTELPRILSRRSLLAAGLLLGAPGDTARAEPDPADGTVGDARPVSSHSLDAKLFLGFRQEFVTTLGVDVEGQRTEGAVINTFVGGSGAPLLLIHGFPETHVAWHRVAGTLARRFTVVLVDLRGCGGSSKPGSSPGHVNYAKRAMGADLVQVMRHLGHDRFQAVGHDRGGRVLQAMMSDHPDAVTRGVVLDIVPTDLMYEHADREIATKYFWWFFHIQEAPLPERFIAALPDYYVRSHFEIQNKTPGSVPAPILDHYVEAYTDPAAIHAVCEDFRAGAGVDSRIQKADREAGRIIGQPLMAIWGTEGAIGRLLDVAALWREEASAVTGLALPCGHLIHEEDPEGLLKALDGFLADA